MLDRWHQTNIRNLKEAIKDARGRAEDEAKRRHPWVRSRGTFIWIEASTLQEVFQKYVAKMS